MNKGDFIDKWARRWNTRMDKGQLETDLAKDVEELIDTEILALLWAKHKPPAPRSGEMFAFVWTHILRFFTEEQMEDMCLALYKRLQSTGFVDTAIERHKDYVRREKKRQGGKQDGPTG